MTINAAVALAMHKDIRIVFISFKLDINTFADGVIVQYYLATCIEQQLSFELLILDIDLIEGLLIHWGSLQMLKMLGISRWEAVFEQHGAQSYGGDDVCFFLAHFFTRVRI